MSKLLVFTGEAYDRHGFKLLEPEPVAGCSEEEAFDRFIERVEALVTNTPLKIGFVLLTFIEEREISHD